MGGPVAYSTRAGKKIKPRQVWKVTRFLEDGKGIVEEMGSYRYP